MSSEGYSCSEDSISPELTKRNPSLNDGSVYSGHSTQRTSPVPSCVSMRTDRSMEPPDSFGKASSVPSHQRSPLLCHRKKQTYKSWSRSACVCDETCRATTHRANRAETCACCGGIITHHCSGPACKNLTATKRPDSANHLVWVLLPGILCIIAAVVYFIGSSQLKVTEAKREVSESVPSVQLGQSECKTEVPPEQEAKSKVEVPPEQGNIPLAEVEKAVELGLMLLGQSEAGKGSVGNTILGRQVFEEDFSLSAETKGCETRSSVISRWKVKITDAPDLSDESFVNCFRNTSSIHAFLLVVRLGKITPEEIDNIRRIREVMGSRALKHTLVLFRGRDLLDGKSFSELLDNSSVLKEILSVCEGGYHIFSDRDRTEVRQVEELLLKIEAVVYKNSVYNKEIDKVENVHDVKNITEHTDFSYISLLYNITSLFIRFCGFVIVASCLLYVLFNIINENSRPNKQVTEHYMTDEMKASEIKTKKPSSANKLNKVT